MLIPLGTNEGVMSYPDEQIGYLASDQYSSRIASPAQGGGYLHKLHSNSSQPNIESPLRKTSFPADTVQRSEFDKSKGSVSGRSEAIDSEAEDDVVHVDDPPRRYNKITGGEETINEAEDLGPNGGDTPEYGGYIDENGYGAPILASDEVAKDVGGEHMQPAVSPRQERRGSAYYLGDEYGSGNITPMSRPTSRPASMHGFNTSLSRFLSRHDDSEELHTPLEDVEEYEPLFPDEDENKKRPVDAAERFKQRPGTLKHRFPSQDIWEDTPSSAMHVTVVSTPEPQAQNDSAGAKPASKTFEDPSVESARKGEFDEAEKSKLVPREERLAKSKFAPHLRDDMPTRPGMQQRFPSRDIWEDTPDSMQLVTTVASPPPAGDDAQGPDEATANKPSIPPRPVNRSKLAESSTSNVPVSAEVKQPQVPARPPKRMHTVPPADAKLTDVTIPPSQPLDKNISPTDGKKGPSLPDRPKPQVPARPAKKESLETLTKTFSGGSSGSQETVTSPPLPKSKPTVPARPAGNRANLPTAFMSDLNQRLQLGPRPPVKEKDPEPVAEKEALPLSDARKGRAKGPQRRAPAKSPSSSAETRLTALPTFTIYSPRPLWSINEEGGLLVNGYSGPSPLPQETVPEVLTEEVGSKTKAVAAARSSGAPKPLAPTGLALNTAGESADPSPFGSATATPGTEKSDPLGKSIGSIVRENREGVSSLSKQSTASSGAISGGPLERVANKNEEAGRLNDSNSGASGDQHDTLSTATTATSMASGEALNKVLTREERTGAEGNDKENVLAAGEGAEPTPQKDMPATSMETSSRFENDMPEHVGSGHGELRTESGMKTNIPDRKLEEMTAIADGKGHATEEQGVGE
jgi:Altered inheritance of mitochondria protein 21